MCIPQDPPLVLHVPTFWQLTSEPVIFPYFNLVDEYNFDLSILVRI